MTAKFGKTNKIESKEEKEKLKNKKAEFSTEGLNSSIEHNLEHYWQRRNTYHSFGFGACHQIGQEILSAQLPKHMGIVSHHYGDLFHHFSPSSSRAQAQLPVSCSHPAEDARGEGGSAEREQEPANQLCWAFPLLGALGGNTCSHCQHLPCGEVWRKAGTCLNSSVGPKIKQQEKNQVSVKRENICQSLMAALKSLLCLSSLVAIVLYLYPVFSRES